jgi:hypothetical protein
MRPIVELRQYTLRPGAWDALAELFDRALWAGQEEVGIHVLGVFRDLDDPDRFVWLRSFPDMKARLRSLEAFYTGPVWREHSKAANATMIDCDDVLLLRPAREPWTVDGAELTAIVLPLHAPAEDGFLEAFEHDLEPLVARAGAPALACFVTDPSPNTFPALPVREDESVLVRISAPLPVEDGWRSALQERAGPWLKGTPQVLRLAA